MNRLTLEDALMVCASMRERDRRCVRAALGEVSYDVFAVNRWQTDGPAWSLHQDGAPVAIFGLSFQNDWVATAWLVATPQCSLNSWGKLLRFAKTVRNQAMGPGPFHKGRIEAQVLVGWSDASRFAGCLGFVLEGIKRRAGSGGEDFEIWAVT